MTANIKENTLVEENENSETDVKSKEYVLDIFKSMYETYAKKFKEYSETSKEVENMSEQDIADKFADNILPGFFDFALTAEHQFSSIIKPDISNYLSVKHGCWLNTIDFMTKYPSDKFHLAMGFIVHKDDLEKVRVDIRHNYVPVYIDLIPHGFIVDNDGDIFDPTIGENEDYHYFYKIVEPEIWKSFKYFYNNSRDWWVSDFADWTKTKIREAKETKEFYKFVGINVEDEVPAENPEEITTSDASQETEPSADGETVSVQIRNDNGELVSSEEIPVETVKAERDDNGVSISTEETVEGNTSEGSEDNDSNILNFFSDSYDGNDRLLTEASGFKYSPDSLMGDFEEPENLPSDKELEKDIDSIIEKRLGELVKVAKDQPGFDHDVEDPVHARQQINTQINEFEKKIADTFNLAVENGKKYIRNTVSTVSIKGIGTLDSAAKTFYSMRFDTSGNKLPGEKTSRSKNALGLEDEVPFYMTYLCEYVDNDGNVVEAENFAVPPENATNVRRSLSIVQPNPVYQFRTTGTSDSIVNLPVEVTDQGYVSQKGAVKSFIKLNNRERKLFAVFIITTKELESTIVSLVPEAKNTNFDSDTYVIYQAYKYYDSVMNIKKDIEDLGLENSCALVYGNQNHYEYVLNGLFDNFEYTPVQKQEGETQGDLLNRAKKNKKEWEKKVGDFIKKDFTSEFEKYIPDGFYLQSSQKLNDRDFNSFKYPLLKFNEETKEYEPVVKEVKQDKKTIAVPEEAETSLDKNYSLKIGNSYLYRIKEDSSFEDIANWIFAYPKNYMGSKTFTLIYSDKGVIHEKMAVALADKFMSRPDVNDAKTVKEYKRFEWLAREYDKETASNEFDTQKHRTKSSYDRETTVDPFAAFSSIETSDINTASTEGYDVEWIKRQLFEGPSSLLNQLYKHYSISLLVKLKFFLDGIRILPVTGLDKERIKTISWQGIVYSYDARTVDMPKPFAETDDYTISVITNAAKSQENPDLEKIVDFNNEKKVTDLKTKQDKLTDTLNKYKQNAEMYGVIDRGGNGFQFYVNENGRYKEVSREFKPSDKFFTKLEEDKTGNLVESDKIVCCYTNAYGQLTLEDSSTYIEKMNEELKSVRESFNRGTHLLYSDIANVIMFGMNHGCYKNGEWIRKEGRDERTSIMNLLTPIAFGVSKYNTIVEKLNVFYRLPLSLFPENSTVDDLVILKQKLDDCKEIMEKYHKTYEYQRFHYKGPSISDPNKTVEDHDSPDSDSDLEMNNTNYYVKLYSTGISNKDGIEETALAYDSEGEQEEKWNKFSQYVNLDIYPQILEDEYSNLIQLARDQERGFVKIRITSKMKEFSDRITGMPFDFTTKSVLFTALRNQTAVRAISSELNNLFNAYKNGETSTNVSLDSDYLGSIKGLSWEERQTTQLAPRTSKEMAGSRDQISQFLRQMDKLKKSPEYSFLSKLVYQVLDDEDIWNLRDTICEKFGLDLGDYNANKEILEDTKRFFVAAVRQLMRNYTGYHISKVVSLREKIATDKYCLRDINIYYKTTLRDILGSLDAYIEDLKQEIAKNDSGKTDGLKKVKDSLLYIMKHKSQGLTLEKMKAMEFILDSEKIIGDKYYWLLDTINDIGNNYKEYRKYNKELKDYIKEELKKYKPTSSNVEDEIKTDDKSKEDADKNKEAQAAEDTSIDAQVAEDVSLRPIEDFLLENLMQTWSVSMFDGFKKKQELNKEQTEIEEVTVYRPFANEDELSINSREAWRKVFKLDDAQIDKMFRFLRSLSNARKEIVKNMTMSQIITVNNSVLDKNKKEEDSFKVADKFIDTINDLQEISQKNKIVSFSSVGSKSEPVKTNATYPSDVRATFNWKNPVEWVKLYARLKKFGKGKSWDSLLKVPTDLLPSSLDNEEQAKERKKKHDKYLMNYFTSKLKELIGKLENRFSLETIGNMNEETLMEVFELSVAGKIQDAVDLIGSKAQSKDTRQTDTVDIDFEED